MTWKKLTQSSGGGSGEGNGNQATVSKMLNTPELFKGKASKGFVTFIDDDCRTGAYTKLKPLFESRGKRFSLACATGFIDGKTHADGMTTAMITGTQHYMTWDQIREMQENGHEILPHSVYHMPHGALTPERLHYELSECKKRLNEEGILGEYYVYPNCSHTEAVQKTVLEHYKVAFTCMSNNMKPNKPPLMSSVLARTALGASGSTDLNALKAQCLNAKNTGEWLVFMSHIDLTDSTWNNTNSLSAVTEILDYCIENDIEVVTVREALRRMGDVVRIGHNDIPDEPYYVIGSDYKVHTNVKSLPTRNTVHFEPEDNTIMGSEPPSAFFLTELGNAPLIHYATINYGRMQNNTNLPVQLQGTLITESLNSRYYGYSRQTYRVYNSNDTYVRPGMDANTWGAWVKVATTSV